MDDSALRGLRRWATLLDSAFRVPGTPLRFGLDPIVGLLPGVGDLASPIFAILILFHAVRRRLPKVVLARMVLNAVIDLGIGAIPIAGDLFDFAWKSNAWNLALLERHAHADARPSAGDWLFVLICIVIVSAAALVPIIVIVWLLTSVPLV